MKKLEDLFEHQIKDLYSAESQLMDALPKMVEHAHDDKLRQAFQDHLKETEHQKERLLEVCKSLNIEPTGETCNAMKGLISEAEGFLKEDASSEVRDAGLIAEAQRVEHYEISGYGTAVKYAKQLGHTDAASLLLATLDEEYNADQKLDKMTQSRINQKAMS